MKIDLAQLNRRVDSGLVRTQTQGNLTIYTYTQKCQYEKAWDKYTRMCRGIILDKEGNVVCRTFDKFFNLNEMPETKFEDIPTSGYKVYEKLDGSLLQMFDYNGELRVSTKGSFSNIYTEYAQKLMKDGVYKQTFNRNMSAAFEIVLPPELDTMPRAVPHEPGMYFLSAFDNWGVESRREYPFHLLRNCWTGPAAKVFENLSFNKMLELVKSYSSTEGWVVHYSEQDLRLKIKTDWFMRVFRVISQIDEKHIKQLMLAQPVDKEWLQDIPEELLPEAKRILSDIRGRLGTANSEIWDAYIKVKHLPRKEVAITLQDYKYRPFIFNLLDGKDFQNKLLEVV